MPVHGHAAIPVPAPMAVAIAAIGSTVCLNTAMKDWLDYIFHDTVGYHIPIDALTKG